MAKSTLILSYLLFFSLAGNAQDEKNIEPAIVKVHFNESFTTEEVDGILTYRWKYNNEKVSEYINTSCIVEPGGGIYKDYACKGLLVKGVRQGMWELKKCDTGVKQEVRYNKGLITGRYKAHFKTRKAVIEKGKQQWRGVDTTFYETDFTNGNGLWKNFYSNGEVSEEGSYKLGKKEGKWMYYTKKGHFLYLEIYYEAGLIKTREEYKIPPEDMEYEY